jgi:hypothetical protein
MMPAKLEVGGAAPAGGHLEPQGSIETLRQLEVLGRHVDLEVSDRE